MEQHLLSAADSQRPTLGSELDDHRRHPLAHQRTTTRENQEQTGETHRHTPRQNTLSTSEPKTPFGRRDLFISQRTFMSHFPDAKQILTLVQPHSQSDEYLSKQTPNGRVVSLAPVHTASDGKETSFPFGHQQSDIVAAPPCSCHQSRRTHPTDSLRHDRRKHSATTSCPKLAQRTFSACGSEAS